MITQSSSLVKHVMYGSQPMPGLPGHYSSEVLVFKEGSCMHCACAWELHTGILHGQHGRQISIV